MTRISKQQERRMRSPRKNKKPAVKTGPLKENLSLGYKEAKNALAGTSLQESVFISKIR